MARSSEPATPSTAQPPPRRMPAEWEPHAATWLCWPHNPETWPGCLDEAQAEFTVLVAALAASEPAQILVQSAEHEAEVRARLERAQVRGAHLHRVATNDSWLRDIGPTFVWQTRAGSATPELLGLDWRFNCWGGKYEPWDRDDAAAGAIAALAGVPSERMSLTLEGGALEVDGAGTLLATRSSILNPNRNPGLAQTAVEAELRAQLGVREIVWLDGDLAGDDTDAHIDQLARFSAPGQLLCARARDSRHPSAAALEDFRKQLQSARDAAGRSFEVLELALPDPIETPEGWLPASPLNFLVTNRAVLVPTFASPSDEQALAQLGRLYPDRRVVPVPSRALARGLGSVHCLSQQQPSLAP
jgi:agmatine deiminase